MQKRKEAYIQIGMVCVFRSQGLSEGQVAKRAKFESVEDMYLRLKRWGLTGLLPPVAQVETPKRQATRAKPERQARKLGPVKELPTAGNATELFKERLEALLRSAELLEHMDEGLHGRYFVRQDVETATVLFSWEHLSEVGREALRKQHGPDFNEDFVDPNALVKLPGGVALSPSETEAILIGVYALAGGDMDRLLDALHLDSSSVGAETREEIRQCIEGFRPDDKKDGLKVLARQLATWVRGSEVRPGRRSGRSKADHAFACAITHLRNQGLSDEEIARKEAHRRKEDGISYTIKDIAELGDLGLSWR
jgi:hypothetical protein